MLLPSHGKFSPSPSPWPHQPSLLSNKRKLYKECDCQGHLAPTPVTRDDHQGDRADLDSQVWVLFSSVPCAVLGKLWLRRDSSGELSWRISRRVLCGGAGWSFLEGGIACRLQKVLYWPRCRVTWVGVWHQQSQVEKRTKGGSGDPRMSSREGTHGTCWVLLREDVRVAAGSHWTC